jgi:hypothetical protein
VRRKWGAVLALAILAGCSEPAPLTRSEYVREGNEVCREVAGRWKELEPPPMDDPVTEEAFAELTVWDLKTGNELGGEVVDRLGALQPPAELEDDSTRMLDALQSLLDVTDAYAAAVESRNEAELARLEQEADDDVQEVFQREARALGLDVCAKGLFLSSWRAGATPAAPQEGLDLDQPLLSSSLSGAGR